VMALSFDLLQWLFPIVLTAHNLEEAIMQPGFTARHASRLRWKVGASEFRFAIVVVTIAGWAVTYLSWRGGRESVGSYLLFGCVVATLANVLVPHIPAAFVFRGYVPGLVTAVLLNLPVMWLLATLAVREGWVSGGKAVLYGVGVPLGTVALIPGLFALGRMRRGWKAAAGEES